MTMSYFMMANFVFLADYPVCSLDALKCFVQ